MTNLSGHIIGQGCQQAVGQEVAVLLDKEVRAPIDPYQDPVEVGGCAVGALK